MQHSPCGATDSMSASAFGLSHQGSPHRSRHFNDTPHFRPSSSSFMAPSRRQVKHGRWSFELELRYNSWVSLNFRYSFDKSFRITDVTMSLFTDERLLKQTQVSFPSEVRVPYNERPGSKVKANDYHSSRAQQQSTTIFAGRSNSAPARFGLGKDRLNTSSSSSDTVQGSVLLPHYRNT